MAQVNLEIVLQRFDGFHAHCTELRPAAVVVAAQSAEVVAPNRISLPSILPMEVSLIAGLDAKAGIGCRSDQTVSAKQGTKMISMVASAAKPCRILPV